MPLSYGMAEDPEVDSKWKGVIERALGSWDSVEEWADYISFLSRINKATRYKAGKDARMPLARQISEHLARCLEPRLPAGVHQTALEVYDSVFTTLSPEQLHKDMSIWLPGLLPLMSNAAFSVKPLVIELFSKHILTSSNLRELCRPVLLACLPSIENESSECFQEIMDMLQTLRERLNDDVLFWQCILLCAVTSSESRLGVLAYCQRELPSFQANGPENQLDADARLLISPEPRNFLGAIIQGLRDTNVLVQRGFLDILARNCPLDSPLFSNCPKKDLQMLVYEASHIILRRDMSLNRRLWSWLLGPGQEHHSDQDQHLRRIDYFRKYGADIIVNVLLENLQSDSPQKISETLAVAHGILDRWEIGSVVVPKILPTVLSCAIKFQNQDTVLQGAKQFFNAVESNHIWKSALLTAQSGDVTTPLFMVNTFNIKEEEMMLVHLPLFLMAIIDLRPKITDQEGWSELVLKLLDVISQLSLARYQKTSKHIVDVNDRISKFYEESVKVSESDEDITIDSPFDAESLTSFVVESLIENFCKNPTDVNAVLVEKILSKIPQLDTRVDKLVQTLLSSGVYNADLFVRTQPIMQRIEVVEYIERFVDCCFKASVESGPNLIELIRDLSIVHEASPEFLVPSALAACFSRNISDCVAFSKAFSVLWIHSGDRSEYAPLLTKPTLLFLDQLLSSNSNVESIGRLYVRRSIIQTGTSERLLRTLFDAAKLHENDPEVFEYHVKLVLQLLIFPEIRDVYDSKFATESVQYLHLWVTNHAKNADAGAFASVLSLVSTTYLNSSQEHSTVQLRLLTEFAVFLMGTAKENLNHAIIYFVSDALALLPFEKNVTFGNTDSLAYHVFVFLQTTISWVTSDIDFVALSKLLDQFIAVFHPFISQVLLPTTSEIIQRMTQLESHLLSGTSYSISETESIVQLIVFLEKILITGLQLLYPENQNSKEDGPDVPTSSTSNLIGSVISGVFSVESPADRSTLESGRVMLFEALDLTMKKCCRYWCFLDSVRKATMRESKYSSTLHSTSRLKTRLRKLTSLLYRQRPVETIKLAAVHCETNAMAVRMVHNFEGTLYRESVQVIIGQITGRKDGKTSDTVDLLDAKLSNGDFMDFFVTYIKSLEVDVVEDIWPTLLGFLNDINSKSAQHEEILLKVLYLCTVMSDSGPAEKSPQRRKPQKEFADIFQKLVLTALSDIPVANLIPEKAADSFTLVDVLPYIGKIIPDQDRQATVFTKVLNATVAPSLKGNELSSVSPSVFNLLGLVIEHSSQSKVWKSIVGDLMFDSKLFTLTVEQATLLMPVVDKWAQVDKERITEFLSRIANYGSNSVLFGWTGTAKLTKENLNRLAYILLSGESLGVNYSKLVNQLSTIWASGSVADVCTLLRACILRQEKSQLSAVYSFLTFKLQEFFSDLLTMLDSQKVKEKDLRDPVTVSQLLEASKLLDLLLTLNSDQVQVYEWLFICDTTDAIYTNDEDRSGDVVDKLALSKNFKRLDPITSSGMGGTPPEIVPGQKRRPLLHSESTVHDLRLFFGHLSISFYESIYGLSAVDESYCRQMILTDLFV